MAHQLSEMTPTRRRLEYLVRFFVFYSVVCYFTELECCKEGRSTGFWLWNERFVAIFFTLEYIIRFIESDNRAHFPFKVLSIIDLIAIAPFYIGFFVDDQTLDVIRTLRMLRLFKLVRYNPALMNIFHGLKKVKDELAMVGYVVVMVVLFSSTLMYALEHDAQPDKFAKPTDAVWWCFVTLTTVGYGDLAPVTLAGRALGILTMILGIGIFGIFVSLVGSAFLADIKEKHDKLRTTDGNMSKADGTTQPPRAETQEAVQLGDSGSLG